MFAKVNQKCLELYQLKKQVEEALVRERSLDDQLDLLYQIKQSAEALDEIKKDFNRMYNTLKDVVLVQRGPSLEKTHKTPNVTVTFKEVYSPKLPRRGTEEHEQFLSWFGVPKEKAHCLQAHWPTLKEYFTELQANGKNPPTVESYLETNLTFRNRK